MWNNCIGRPRYLAMQDDDTPSQSCLFELCMRTIRGEYLLYWLRPLGSHLGKLKFDQFGAEFISSQGFPGLVRRFFQRCCVRIHASTLT